MDSENIREMIDELQKENGIEKLSTEEHDGLLGTCIGLIMNILAADQGKLRNNDEFLQAMGITGELPDDFRLVLMYTAVLANDTLNEAQELRKIVANTRSENDGKEHDGV